ncbi:MAG: hypothetical protein AAF519_03055 [Bacteroidota bacterium]
MKTTLAFTALLILTLPAFAQYKNSSGIRLGYTSGLTYKRFISNEQAMEFMASGRNEGFQFTTLYQFHKPMDIGFNDDFYLYYGVGAHVGYERLDDRRLNGPFNSPTSEFQTREQSFFTMGVNTILGVEYRWLKIPMTVSVDIKPYLDFIGMRRTKLRFWDTAISFKYIF